MENPVTITVLSMCYNKAKTIRRTYESLLLQTNKDFEWLIINDGSTDNLKTIIKDFNTDTFKIRFIDKENEGPANTFNLGVKESHGKMIFRLDPDDYITPDAIQKILDYMYVLEKDPKLCGLVFLSEFENGEIVGTHPYKKNRVSNFFDYRYYDRATGDRAEVIKKNIFLEFPWPKYGSEKFVLESSFWFPMALKYDAYYVNYPIYVREYNNNSITAASSSTYKNNPIGCVENILLKYKIFKRKNKNIYIFTEQLKSCMLYYRYGLYSKYSLTTLYKKMPGPWNVIGFIPGLILHYTDRLFPRLIPNITKKYKRLRNKDNFTNLKIKQLQ